MIRSVATTLCLMLAGCVAVESDSQRDSAAPSISFLDSIYPEAFSDRGVELSGAVIARGDSLYHGVTGSANCYMCHGPFLRGSSEGTNLRDDKWHNIDGTLSAVDSIIRAGVSKPDHMTMPPRGGMPISDADVKALAAYVYWSARTKSRTH